MSDLNQGPASVYVRPVGWPSSPSPDHYMLVLAGTPDDTVLVASASNDTNPVSTALTALRALGTFSPSALILIWAASGNLMWRGPLN
jgi:hypothetical protein